MLILYNPSQSNLCILFFLMGGSYFKTGSDKLKNSPTSFFDLKAKDIEGNLIDFSMYRNKKAILVVNVACK
jgi:hypothetical protein